MSFVSGSRQKNLNLVGCEERGFESLSPLSE